MKVIHLYGSKGGVQTSTVAALTALSHDGDVVLIDLAGDQHTIMGLTHDDRICHLRLAEATELKPRLRLLRTTESFVGPLIAEADIDAVDLVVVDHGVVKRDRTMVVKGAHIVVVQACYLSVRRAVQAGRWDGWILTNTETGRTLTDRDVMHAMGSPPLLTLPHSPAIARCLDAGLLATRAIPSTFTRQLTNFIKQGVTA